MFSLVRTCNGAKGGGGNKPSITEENVSCALLNVTVCNDYLSGHLKSQKLKSRSVNKIKRVVER